jgi:dCMP deaminase
MTKQEKYNKFFMDVALRTAENSYARRMKVGSVLVKDFRIVATGWQGTPAGFDNACEEKIDQDGPDEVSNLKTKQDVIHSEANIIYFCAKHGIKTDGTTLYITLSPCVNCALAIIQAGIKRVYYHVPYRDDSGIKVLRKAGIMIDEL